MPFPTTARLRVGVEPGMRVIMMASQPPVIGGKNAISRAPASGASGLACTLSIAARTTPPFSNAGSYSSPPALVREGVVVFLAAALEPSDEVGDGRDRRRQLDLLLGQADAFADPGEI